MTFDSSEPAGLPEVLARARARAEQGPRRPLAPEEVEGLRRAVRRELDREGLVLTKALTDGAAGPAERRLLAAAMARLAGLYEVALAAAPEEAGGLVEAVEARARAVAALLAGEAEGARRQAARSEEALAEVPASTAAAVDPPALVEVAGRVFDRATGRSRYDPDEEDHLPFRLACPRDVCGAIHDVRLHAGHSTHRLTCPACGGAYLLYLAPVRAAARRVGDGAAVHEVETRDVDGTLRTLRFEDPMGGRGMTLRAGELLIAAYDGENRLRRVRAYGRGDEVRVPVPARCFVASAAAGPFAPEVVELRRLRDEVLVRHALGRRFVAWYARRGPALAARVAGSPGLRRAVRAGLRALAPVSAGVRVVLGRLRA